MYPHHDPVLVELQMRERLVAAERLSLLERLVHALTESLRKRRLNAVRELIQQRQEHRLSPDAGFLD